MLRRVRAATDPDPLVRLAVRMLVFDPANAVRTLTTAHAPAGLSLLRAVGHPLNGRTAQG